MNVADLKEAPREQTAEAGEQGIDVVTPQAEPEVQYAASEFEGDNDKRFSARLDGNATNFVDSPFEEYSKNVKRPFAGMLFGELQREYTPEELADMKIPKEVQKDIMFMAGYEGAKFTDEEFYTTVNSVSPTYTDGRRNYGNSTDGFTATDNPIDFGEQTYGVDPTLDNNGGVNSFADVQEEITDANGNIVVQEEEAIKEVVDKGLTKDSLQKMIDSVNSEDLVQGQYSQDTLDRTDDKDFVYGLGDISDKDVGFMTRVLDPIRLGTMKFDEYKKWNSREKTLFNMLIGSMDDNAISSPASFEKSVKKLLNLAKPTDGNGRRKDVIESMRVLQSRFKKAKNGRKASVGGGKTDKTYIVNEKKHNQIVDGFNGKLIARNDDPTSPTPYMNELTDNTVKSLHYVTDTLGRDVVVGSTTGGGHSPDSTHYYGRGADIQMYDGDDMKKWSKKVNGKWVANTDSPKYDMLKNDMIKLSNEENTHLIMTPIGNFFGGRQITFRPAAGHHNHIHFQTASKDIPQQEKEIVSSMIENPSLASYEVISKLSDGAKEIWNASTTGKVGDKKVSKKGFEYNQKKLIAEKKAIAKLLDINKPDSETSKVDTIL